MLNTLLTLTMQTDYHVMLGKNFAMTVSSTALPRGHRLLIFFLVFYHILNWYTCKHINSLNRYPSTPKEFESWKTTKEKNTHSEKLRGGELALRLEGEKKEAEK